jgi:hypothetical protein
MSHKNSELINTLLNQGMYMVLDKSFDGLKKVSQHYGRYIISDHPPGTFEFMLPSSKTFWIQETPHFFFLGLWSGSLYMSNNVNTFQKAVEHLFLTSFHAPSTLQDEFVNGEDLWKIEIFSLVDEINQREMKTTRNKFLKDKSVTEYNSWYIMEIPPLSIYFSFPETDIEEFPLDIAVQNRGTEDHPENSRRIICEYFHEQFLLS